MPINVGRIDRTMAGRNMRDPPRQDADEEDRIVFDALAAAARHAAPAAGPRGLAAPAGVPPAPPPPIPPPLLPMHLVQPIDSVEAALELFAGLEPAVLHRVLAGFGGVLEAGQVAYLLGTTGAIADEMIDRLDEVGDRRVGIEELETENVSAALEELRAGGF